MKNKLLLSGLLLLLMCPIPRQMRAQNSLFIRLNNGTQSSVALSSLNKITFSTEEMFLKQNDTTTKSFTIGDINKITFGFSSGLTDILDESSISVYPNPASDLIRLKNLPTEETKITVYRLDGEIVIQNILNSSSQTININGLTNGLYLIRTGNKTLKFTKQ